MGSAEGTGVLFAHTRCLAASPVSAGLPPAASSPRRAPWALLLQDCPHRFVSCRRADTPAGLLCACALTLPSEEQVVLRLYNSALLFTGKGSRTVSSVRVLTKTFIPLFNFQDQQPPSPSRCCLISELALSLLLVLPARDSPREPLCSHRPALRASPPSPPALLCEGDCFSAHS